MRLSLPHSLGKEEVRRRLQEHGHEIADQFPAGMAEVEIIWPEEDRMDLFVQAMGQEIAGRIDIAESKVDIELDLPAMLSFLSGTIEGAVRKNGERLLEKD